MAVPELPSGNTATDQMARLAGSKRSTRGSLISVRRLGRTDATFSRTSSAALRPSMCNPNSMITTDWPSYEREVRALMPAMLLTPSSSFLVTSLSTISGEAPGYSVLITTTGKSTLGNWSTRSRCIENSPSTTKASMTMVANTGLPRLTRVNHIQGFVGALAPSWTSVLARKTPTGPASTRVPSATPSTATMV